jgi:hypothetical protein
MRVETAKTVKSSKGLFEVVAALRLEWRCEVDGKVVRYVRYSTLGQHTKGQAITTDIHFDLAHHPTTNTPTATHTV